MSTIIEIEKVNVTINEQTILQEVNLSINEGEILAIVGGSGVGKTTLLRALLLLVPATGLSLIHI